MFCKDLSTVSIVACEVPSAISIDAEPKCMVTAGCTELEHGQQLNCKGTISCFIAGI